MMRTLTLTILVASLGTATFADSWTATGRYGGFGSGTYDCQPSANGTTCKGSGSWTGPRGYTSYFTRQWKQTPDGVVVKRRSTGPNGRVSTFTRTRTR